MNVAELIECLQKFDPELPVCVRRELMGEDVPSILGGMEQITLHTATLGGRTLFGFVPENADLDQDNSADVVLLDYEFDYEHANEVDLREKRAARRAHARETCLKGSDFDPPL